MKHRETSDQREREYVCVEEKRKEEVEKRKRVELSSQG